MNKVNKSDKVPGTLARRGILETQSLRDNVAANKPLAFIQAVYAAPDVKAQLRKDQNGKCAYCERYFNGDYGAVEHFRPKGAYQATGEGKLYKPAYYWLAYAWDNLLYSCSECNTTYKRNFFPLLDEKGRDIVHEDITREQPMLLDPVKDEIGDYVEFHRYLIVAKSTAVSKIRAEKTIELFQLNHRSVLVERRKKVWNDYARLDMIRKIAERKGSQEILDTVNSLISEMTSEEAEFTGMFKYQRMEQGGQ